MEKSGKGGNHAVKAYRLPRNTRRRLGYKLPESYKLRILSMFPVSKNTKSEIRHISLAIDSRCIGGKIVSRTV